MGTPEHPSPPSKGSDLAGISCPSTRECTSVGHYIDKAGELLALVEHWNGAKWEIQTVPFPPKQDKTSSGPSRASSPANVSPLVSTKQILQARYARRAPYRRQLGNTHNYQSPETKWSELQNTSCATSESCIAVGHYENNADEQLTSRKSSNKDGYGRTSTTAIALAQEKGRP
jgi:hypothetical protein